MRPSQVREHVLRDHVELRGVLARMDTLAAAVRAGDEWRSRELRDVGAGLLERLREHMRWEDVHLGPALSAADAWGDARQGRLEEDHREQRETLDYVLRQIEDRERPIAVLAGDLIAFSALLRRDMQEEEQELLSPRVLRDDVVGIDVETG